VVVRVEERHGKMEAANELEPSGIPTMKEDRGKRQVHLSARVFAWLGCMALDQNLTVEIFWMTWMP
jgi:hypothetical protein